MTYRLHHVHLVCRDLEKMIGFFEEALGAKFVEHRKFGTADGATLDLQETSTCGLRARVKKYGRTLPHPATDMITSACR